MSRRLVIRQFCISSFSLSRSLSLSLSLSFAFNPDFRKSLFRPGGSELVDPPGRGFAIVTPLTPNFLRHRRLSALAAPVDRILQPVWQSSRSIIRSRRIYRPCAPSAAQCISTMIQSWLARVPALFAARLDNDILVPGPGIIPIGDGSSDRTSGSNFDHCAKIANFYRRSAVNSSSPRPLVLIPARSRVITSLPRVTLNSLQIVVWYAQY